METRWSGRCPDSRGRDALGEASNSGGGSSVLLEALIGGAGALLILLFVFGTLPAVLMPLDSLTAVPKAWILNLWAAAGREAARQSPKAAVRTPTRSTVRNIMTSVGELAKHRNRSAV